MKILSPSLLIICFLVFGGVIFKATSPKNCETIYPNDNIFVLTGDVRRIPFAMRQLREHPSLKLYIIGAGTQGYYSPSKKIEIESESKSTYENALAIKKIVNEKNLHRIVLITTEDHINRAKYLIKTELPNTEIVTCPVPLTGMTAAKRLERWAIEYVKYIVTMIGIKEG